MAEMNVVPLIDILLVRMRSFSLVITPLNRRGWYTLSGRSRIPTRSRIRN